MAHKVERTAAGERIQKSEEASKPVEQFGLSPSPSETQKMSSKTIPKTAFPFSTAKLQVTTRGGWSSSGHDFPSSSRGRGRRLRTLPLNVKDKNDEKEAADFKHPNITNASFMNDSATTSPKLDRLLHPLSPMQHMQYPSPRNSTAVPQVKPHQEPPTYHPSPAGLEIQPPEPSSAPMATPSPLCGIQLHHDDEDDDDDEASYHLPESDRDEEDDDDTDLEEDEMEELRKIPASFSRNKSAAEMSESATPSKNLKSAPTTNILLSSGADAPSSTIHSQQPEPLNGAIAQDHDRESDAGAIFATPTEPSLKEAKKDDDDLAEELRYLLEDDWGANLDLDGYLAPTKGGLLSSSSFSQDDPNSKHNCSELDILQPLQTTLASWSPPPSLLLDPFYGEASGVKNSHATGPQGGWGGDRLPQSTFTHHSSTAANMSNIPTVGGDLMSKTPSVQRAHSFAETTGFRHYTSNMDSNGSDSMGTATSGGTSTVMDVEQSTSSCSSADTGFAMGVGKRARPVTNGQSSSDNIQRAHIDHGKHQTSHNEGDALSSSTGISEEQVVKLRGLLRGHYQLLLQQAVLSVRTLNMQKIRREKGEREGASAERKEKGKKGSTSVYGCTSSDGEDKGESGENFTYYGSETAEDLAEILDGAVGMLQELNENRKDTIRTAIQQVDTSMGSSKLSHDVESLSPPTPIDGIRNLEKTGLTVSSGSPGVPHGGSHKNHRVLTRLAFNRTLQERYGSAAQPSCESHPHRPGPRIDNNEKGAFPNAEPTPAERHVQSFVNRDAVHGQSQSEIVTCFDVRGLSRLNETFNSIDQSVCGGEAKACLNILDSTEHGEACDLLLQQADALLLPQYLPGRVALSALLTDPREAFGNDFLPPSSRSQEMLLRRRKDFFTASEDKLVWRGVNLFGEREWISVMHRFLPSRPVSLISRRYAKVCLLSYRAHGVKIGDDGSLETPPELSDGAKLDEAAFSTLHVVAAPAKYDLNRWSFDEDLTILRSVALVGRMWAEISNRLIKHRNRGHLRKRYQVLERRVKAALKWDGKKENEAKRCKTSKQAMKFIQRGKKMGETGFNMEDKTQTRAATAHKSCSGVPSATTRNQQEHALNCAWSKTADDIGRDENSTTASPPFVPRNVTPCCHDDNGKVKDGRHPLKIRKRKAAHTETTVIKKTTRTSTEQPNDVSDVSRAEAKSDDTKSKGEKTLLCDEKIETGQVSLTEDAARSQGKSQADLCSTEDRTNKYQQFTSMARHGEECYDINKRSHSETQLLTSEHSLFDGSRLKVSGQHSPHMSTRSMMWGGDSSRPFEFATKPVDVNAIKQKLIDGKDGTRASSLNPPALHGISHLEYSQESARSSVDSRLASEGILAHVLKRVNKEDGTNNLQAETETSSGFGVPSALQTSPASSSIPHMGEVFPGAEGSSIGGFSNLAFSTLYASNEDRKQTERVVCSPTGASIAPTSLSRLSLGAYQLSTNGLSNLLENGFDPVSALHSMSNSSFSEEKPRNEQRQGSTSHKSFFASAVGSVRQKDTKK